MRIEPHLLPYHLEPQALSVGFYLIMDASNELVKEFDSLSDAAAFVAVANGISVEAAMVDCHKRAAAMESYRDNLRKRMKTRETERKND